MPKLRRAPRRLVSTYIQVKPSGKFSARAVVAAGGEATCTRPTVEEAARCAKEKASPP